MATKKSCFIIMPVSTPENLADTYKGDKDHFRHVLDELFVPAIEAAGLKPIPPISKGSEVIHGDIIKNIETAEMLLCDMSILNANVFFELGMRTATNKPVALVTDTVTANVPFDLKLINHHTYSPELNAWEIKNEVETLKSHLESCLENIDGGNALWKYFSVSARAEGLESGASVEGQLALINRQLEDLRAGRDSGRTEKKSDILAQIVVLANRLGINVDRISVSPNEVRITAVAGPDPASVAVFRVEAEKIARGYGRSCRLTWLKDVEE